MPWWGWIVVGAVLLGAELLLIDAEFYFVFLGVAVRELWIPARRSQELVETCATYWHTIDFLWVLIFALLYVMR